MSAQIGMVFREVASVVIGIGVPCTAVRHASKPLACCTHPSINCSCMLADFDHALQIHHSHPVVHANERYKPVGRAQLINLSPLCTSARFVWPASCSAMRSYSNWPRYLSTSALTCACLRLASTALAAVSASCVPESMARISCCVAVLGSPNVSVSFLRVPGIRVLPPVTTAPAACPNRGKPLLRNHAANFFTAFVFSFGTCP